MDDWRGVATLYRTRSNGECHDPGASPVVSDTCRLIHGGADSLGGRVDVPEPRPRAAGQGTVAVAKDHAEKLNGYEVQLAK